MPDAVEKGGFGHSSRILLVTAHDWFASALQAVLEPEGFAFARVRSARTALRDASQIDPALVIIDEGLPDLEASDLATGLIAGPLKPSVPILVYSPNFWHETAQAEAVRAGAWDIIKEPVRSRLIVAKLRRLLEIRRLIEAPDDPSSASGTIGGLFNYSELLRVLRILGAAADRRGGALSCMVVGPTRPEPETSPAQPRGLTGRLCSANTRAGDVCGWVDGSDVGIIAPDTSAEGLAVLMRRLERIAATEPEGSGILPLSAGIVQICNEQSCGEVAAAGRGSKKRASAKVGSGVTTGSQVVSLSKFAEAQNALRQAREEGGGIRIGDLK